MAETQYLNYGDDVDSFIHSLFRQGILNGGRYKGVDTLIAPTPGDPGVGFYVQLNNASSGIKFINSAGSVDGAFSSLVVTSQGLVIHNDTTWDDILINDGDADNDRIDLIVYTHEYDGTPGLNPGTVDVIEGTPAGTPVGDYGSLLSTQVVIGELLVAEDATIWSDCTWTPADTPQIGDGPTYSKATMDAKYAILANANTFTNNNTFSGKSWFNQMFFPKVQTDYVWTVGTHTLAPSDNGNFIDFAETIAQPEDRYIKTLGTKNPGMPLFIRNGCTDGGNPIDLYIGDNAITSGNIYTGYDLNRALKPGEIAILFEYNSNFYLVAGALTDYIESLLTNVAILQSQIITKQNKVEAWQEVGGAGNAQYTSNNFEASSGHTLEYRLVGSEWVEIYGKVKRLNADLELTTLPGGFIPSRVMTYPILMFNEGAGPVLIVGMEVDASGNITIETGDADDVYFINIRFPLGSF